MDKVSNKTLDIDLVIDTLYEYNMWRRGEGEYGLFGTPNPYSSRQLGEAIDSAVQFLKDYKKLKKKLGKERVND